MNFNLIAAINNPKRKDDLNIKIMLNIEEKPDSTDGQVSLFECKKKLKSF